MNKPQRVGVLNYFGHRHLFIFQLEFDHPLSLDEFQIFFHSLLFIIADYTKLNKYYIVSFFNAFMQRGILFYMFKMI